MKLRLVNFRCHKDETFDFGENGLNLISAPSGAGKSSILIGINFALYGTGKNLTNHGQSSSFVEFTFKDLFIRRCKKPNRLVVNYNNGKYEDDAAQNIINVKFGTSFDVIGYIAQNALNSFIVMSPTEKLSFLEKFAFNDIDLPEIKNKCKSLIQKRHEEFIKIMSQVQFLEKVLSELIEPHPVEFPIKTKNIELTKKNEATKYKNCETRIKKCNRKIEDAKNELNDLRVLNAFLKNKDDNLDKICNKLNLLSMEENGIKFIGDDELLRLKEQLRRVLSLEELTTLKTQLNESMNQLSAMRDREISEYQKQIQTKQEILWNEYTKEECIEFINNLKDTKKDCDKLSFLKKQLRTNTLSDQELIQKENDVNSKKDILSEKKELLDMIEKKKRIYHCPSCSSSLILENNKLCIENEHENKIDNSLNEKELILDIKKIKNEIENSERHILNEKSYIENNTKIQKEIDEILSSYDDELNEDSINDDLEQMQNYYKTQLSVESDLKKLTNNLKQEKFSSSYSMFESKVERMKKSIHDLESSSESTDCEDNDNQYDEEELRNLIYREQNKQTELKKISDKKLMFEKEQNKERNEHENLKRKHIDKYNLVREEDELNHSITEFQNMLVDENNQLKVVSENLNMISLYDKYLDEKDKYQNWKNKLAIAKNEEDEIKNKYNASKLLLDKIIESEYISMVNIVDNINLHSQNYLDHFFPDNPITVNLSCFKETKKNSKPQINVEISYKGMDCDINSLSGGETSRVILAFTLALAEMFNTPLLMLDECTASLDSESTSIVFDTIKENFKNKSVLVVAHQCTEGIFDKIIKI